MNYIVFNRLQSLYAFATDNFYKTLITELVFAFSLCLIAKKCCLNGQKLLLFEFISLGLFSGSDFSSFTVKM